MHMDHNRQHRKLQLCQLHMLEEVDRICQEEGLTYYLFGGSALGAVRHGGFIPWDDDLDIAMYRKDYDRFQKVIMESHSHKYFLQSCETDPSYPRVIAKLRLKGTVQQERSFENVNCHNGIYIDIFPIDYVSHSGGFGIWLRGKIVRLCFAYKTVRSGANNRHRMGLKKAFRLVARCIPARWIDNLMTYVCAMENQKPRAYSTVFLSAYGWKRQMHKTETIGSGKRIRFETGMFNAPRDVDTFLRKIYGNYMLLPPPEKQIAHTLTQVDFGVYDAQLEQEVIAEEYSGKKERVIGYTSGVFDLLHAGHLNILKRAKEQCDYLIVGVSTDELVESYKHKKPVMSFEERMAIVSALCYVDQAVPQETLDKLAAWEKYHYHVLFHGDDWKGSPLFQEAEQALAAHQVKIVFFPYTKNVSSTILREKLQDDCKS